MLNIPLSSREITAPGLYIMRWNRQTGLVRIVGEPKNGFQIMASSDTPESYIKSLPPQGQIPRDALFSEPLALTAE